MHASPAAADEALLSLLDQGLNQAIAENETGYISLFAELAGSICDRIGRLDKAVAYFDLIPLHVGNDAKTQLSLDALHLRRGDRERGIAHLKTCNRLAGKSRKWLKLLKAELARHNLELRDLGNEH